MIDESEIRKNYEQFEDERIRKIAINDAMGLRDEVVPILIDEIKKRNLGRHLIQQIHAARRILSKHELEDLKRKIKESACENCKQKSGLKGYEFNAITGLLLITSQTNYQLIVCEKCGNEKRKSATISTLLWGWWSLGGFISMPFFLIDKIKTSFQEDKQSKAIIESFIEQNKITITLNGDSQEIIQKLLKDFNVFEGHERSDSLLIPTTDTPPH